MTNHVMVDLETMGTGNEAAIVSLGAVKFDPMAAGIIDAFYVRVDLASSVAFRLKIDPSTVMWWMDPERNSARKALLRDEAHDLGTALDGFSQWFGTESLPTWGNGATFDNVILRNAYAKIGFECPWKYTHDRCYRTFKCLAPGLEASPTGVWHQALDDATSQARHLQAIVKYLGLAI